MVLVNTDYLHSVSCIIHSLFEMSLKNCQICIFCTNMLLGFKVLRFVGFKVFRSSARNAYSDADLITS